MRPLHTILLILVVSPAPIVAGAIVASDATTGRAQEIIGIAIFSAVFGASTFGVNVEEAGFGRALLGALIAAFLVGVVPVAIYFELGYRIRSRAGLAVCWVITVAPLVVYLALALFLVARIGGCAPMQYECPI
jgi:hypothetical protein